MKTQHTPGPWTSCPVNRTGDCRVFAPDDAAHTLYCSVDVGWGPNAREIAEANARLIAAAPELLAALEDAEAYLARIDEMQPQKDHGLVGRSIRDHVKAAIAKATGKE